MARPIDTNAAARRISANLNAVARDIATLLRGLQNAVQQARTFAEAVPVTGLVMTKVDGTAKGGIVVAVHESIGAPVKFLGTGEQVSDLEPFDAAAFARDVLED